MKRWVTAALALAFLAISAPGQVAAQVSIGVSGGATFPSGDYGDYASVGWIGTAGLTVPIGESGLAVGASGFYGSNSHDIDGDKTNLLGGLGAVGYGFQTGGALTPYVYAGLGMMRHSYKSENNPSLEGSESDLAYGGGVGVGFPLGSLMGAVDAFYVMGSGDIDGTEFFGVTFGVAFPLGGGM